jgi:hypothetical protein
VRKDSRTQLGGRVVEEPDGQADTIVAPVLRGEQSKMVWRYDRARLGLSQLLDRRRVVGVYLHGALRSAAALLRR